MATQHSFRARLVWSKGGQGSELGNHRVEFGGRPALEISAAPQYRGDPSKLNPEELFLASLASCQMLSYLALASRAGIEVLAYEDGAEATLAIAERAGRLLRDLGYSNVSVRAGDGFRGWPEAAPFDAMLITAAVPKLPDELLKQLKAGGRAVLPVGPKFGVQDLILIEKAADGKTVTRSIFPVRFVPATGRP